LLEKKETMVIRLVASAVSGVTTALFTLPFDNIKTKVMKQKKGNSLINARQRWKATIQWLH
jgi:hypothetical protein